MSGNVELRTAAGEQLLGVIAAQQTTIAAQQTTITAMEERVARLEKRLGGSVTKVPGATPAITTRSKATGRPAAAALRALPAGGWRTAARRRRP
jgi:uncharacterized coiled-coil protein SlyX